MIFKGVQAEEGFLFPDENVWDEPFVVASWDLVTDPRKDEYYFPVSSLKEAEALDSVITESLQIFGDADIPRRIVQDLALVKGWLRPGVDKHYLLIQETDLLEGITFALCWDYYLCTTENARLNPEVEDALLRLKASGVKQFQGVKLLRW